MFLFGDHMTYFLAGDWMISILYEGQHIQGSPFNVRVYDASQVKVFGLEGGSVGKEFSFSGECTILSIISFFINSGIQKDRVSERGGTIAD